MIEPTNYQLLVTIMSELRDIKQRIDFIHQQINRIEKTLRKA